MAGQGVLLCSAIPPGSDVGRNVADTLVSLDALLYQP